MEQGVPIKQKKWTSVYVVVTWKIRTPLQLHTNKWHLHQATRAPIITFYRLWRKKDKTNLANLQLVLSVRVEIWIRIPFEDVKGTHSRKRCGFLTRCSLGCCGIFVWHKLKFHSLINNDNYSGRAPYSELANDCPTNQTAQGPQPSLWTIYSRDPYQKNIIALNNWYYNLARGKSSKNVLPTLIFSIVETLKSQQQKRFHKGIIVIVSKQVAKRIHIRLLLTGSFGPRSIIKSFHEPRIM